MEVNSVQNINTNTNTPKVLCKKVTNPYSGVVRCIELPDIKSSNCPLQINVPQRYTHINSFEIPQIGTAHFYKLQNGQKVVIVPTQGEAVIKTHVNVGSMNEPDNLRGISHYIEHNLFNGTQNLDAGEFFRQTGRMGAKTNATTSFSKTDFYISTYLLDDKDLEKSIKLHADMIENPAFRLEQLEKEKGPVTSEIAMVLDNDSNLAMNKSLKNLFQIQSKSTDIIAGEIKNIQNMTREDVINYYKTWYTPDNMVTVITGDIDPQETINLISKNFKKKAVQRTQSSYFEKLTPIEHTIREDFISKKSQSSQIVLSTVGATNSDTKELVKQLALMTYLTGYKSAVLKNKLKNVAVFIDGNIERFSNKPNDNNAMSLVAETTPQKTEKAIKIIYDTIDNIHKNPPTKEELDAVKNNMLRSYSLSVQNSSELNNLVGESFLNANYTELQNFPKFIKNLTTEDIQDAAVKYLNLNKASLVVAHAKDTNEKQILNNYKKTNKIVSFGNSKKEIINPKEIKQIILPNNASVYLNETNSDLSVANVLLSTKIPTNINPIAMLVLNKILALGPNGIAPDKFAQTLDEKAIKLNFECSQRGIACNISSNAKDINYAIFAMKCNLLNPDFSEKTIIDAKYKIADTLNSSSDSSYEYGMKELFKNRYNIFGTKQDYLKLLSQVKLEDVKNLYNYILDNSSCSISVSTSNINSINQDTPFIKTLGEINKKFQNKEYGFLKTFESNNEAKIIKNVNEQKQADISQFYTFEKSGNLKDKVTIDLLNAILGETPNSRLFNDLREKQKLAYKVNSIQENFGNTGIIRLAIYTTTDDKTTGTQTFDNIQKALDGFDKHVNLLKTQKVSNEELDGMKRYLKSKVLDANNSQQRKNISILCSDTKHEGLEFFNKYMKMIDEITAEDIQNAANFVFRDEPVTSIVASKDTINSLN